MAEVTVISPNIVELVGNLQKQFGAPRAERPPPRPPVQSQSGDTAQNRSGQRANAETRPAATTLRRSDTGNAESQQQRPPRQDNFQPDRLANRPSTLFLTQLIGQQGPNRAVTPKRLETGIAAYQRANSGPARSPGGYVFLTRHVDTTI